MSVEASLRAGLGVLALLFDPLASVVRAQATFERIARPGDELPGLPGTVPVGVAGFVIDNNGGVLFRASWAPFSSLCNTGLLYGDPQQVTILQQKCQQAPGLPPGQLMHAWNIFPRLSRTGHLAVRTEVGPVQGATGAAIYAGVPADLQVAGYTSGPALDGSNGTTGGVTEPLLNSPGQVAFRAATYPPGGPPGYQLLAVGTPGAILIAAQTGGTVPSVQNAIFTSIGFGGQNLDDQGKVAYYGIFEGPGITSANDFGYFVWSPEGTTLAARLGSQAPGMDPGVNFVGFDAGPDMGNGNVGFVATVAGPGIDVTNNRGYWAGQPNALVPVMREGQVPPGLGPELAIDDISFSFMGAADDVVIAGTLRGAGIDYSNEEAAWYGPWDDPQLLVREGDHAFDMPDDVVFAFDDVIPPVIGLNGSGDMIMLAGLAGPGIDATNHLGLWFRDGDTASWSRVLQSGDEVDGRIVSALNGASLGILFQPGAGASGHSQSINDDGLFALELRFTDGSKGIYRVTVPEPGGMTATALFALCAASLRRRRAVGP